MMQILAEPSINGGGDDNGEKRNHKELQDYWRHPSFVKHKRTKCLKMLPLSLDMFTTTDSVISYLFCNDRNDETIHDNYNNKNTKMADLNPSANPIDLRGQQPVPESAQKHRHHHHDHDHDQQGDRNLHYDCAKPLDRLNWQPKPTKRRRKPNSISKTTINNNHEQNLSRRKAVKNYYTTLNNGSKILSSLLLFLMILFSRWGCLVQARHYIAPGPCTWTHVPSSSSSSSSMSRDIRLKSFSLTLPSSSSSSFSPSAAAQISELNPTSSFNNNNEFDVSLHCSVPVLTPYTLNLSLIDPHHTVKLSIQCYGGSGNNNFFGTNTASNAGNGYKLSENNFDQQHLPRSTLRLTPAHPSMMAPFEHIRSLKALAIENCLLDRLPSDTFRGLSTLKNLTIRQAVPQSNLAGNGPTDNNGETLLIEPHSFRHVESNLEHLDLSKNNIKTLPTDLFCPFLTLNTLNLSYNHLVDLASFGLIDPATGRLCLQELYDLDLSNNRLEFVPETSGVAALKNLQYLNLSSNHITEITELAFSALRRLNILDISGNSLRTLPGRMFRDSDELRELHLSNNGLIELPQGLFQGLSKLQVLDVGSNQITSDTLTTETFADLIRVIVLDLSNNRLRRLMASTFQNQYSLQVLSLEGNELETIDEGAFATLYNLHTLKLSGNRFRHLPESILTGLFVLSHLSLANNQLEHVHEDAFKNCTNLQILNLSANRLTTIPSALRALNKLQQLNLSANKFTTLTDSGPLIDSVIKELDLSDNYLVNVTRSALRPIAPTLNHLRLDGNRLRTLDRDAFVDLRQTLLVLRLDRNEFTDLTKAFANVKQLDRLQVLNVSHNHVQHFDYSLIPNGLRVLDLSWNRIETLGNSFEREAQIRLEELHCDGNQLKEIQATSVPNSIRVLTLRQNRIEKIDQFAFVAKHNVTYVDLRNNSLRRIDNNAFRLGVQRPTTGYFLTGAAFSNPQAYLAAASNGDSKNLPPPIFLISGNPFYCDCTMEWLQRVNQLVGGVTGSGAISTYPRIGDLDQVECELPFARQASILAINGKKSQTSPSSSGSSGVDTTALLAITTTPASSISTDPKGLNNPPLLSSGGNHRMIKLLQANTSNFLCRYRSHCFALCHCCEFDACDCEMMCPENCTCYYDQTWNTNIVDCSGGHYRQVPLRIPMDVTALYLDGNHLQSLNAHTFIGRKNLRILHLNHSMVESISNRSFNGLVYLEELHLDHNLLSGLYGYEFESLNYLTILNLDHNRLTFINDRTFHPLRSLQSLRLNNNLLTTFGQWFSSDLLASSSLSTAASNPHNHHHHHHHHHQVKLSLTLADNPWSCQCSSLASMYETLWKLRQRVILVDGPEVSCQNGTALFVAATANHLVDQCNLTRQYYSMLYSPGSNIMNYGQQPPQQQQPNLSRLPPFAPPSSSTQQEYYPTMVPPSVPSSMSPNHPSAASPMPPNFPQNGNSFDSIYHHVRNNRPTYPPLAEDENDPDLTYQPIDLLGGLRSKLGPSGPNHTGGGHWPGSPFSSSSPSFSPSSNFRSSDWLWIVLVPTIVLILVAIVFMTIRHKQDIQLWFYGHYGIRLFESGFCFGSGDGSGGSGSGSVSSSRSRRRNGRNGFNDTYVRDSEKLFDAFVIYARQDEQFVAQQLAAELECGYPPYRLCLRYRDLPAPTSSVDNLNGANGGQETLSTKDHGYAFDAVTQAIECSRRTLVVISEQFLQSEWCKFELKAAHQETLTSCKTHRLIVVVIPTGHGNPTTGLASMSPSIQAVHQQQMNHNNNNNNNNNNNFSTAKQAELLLQRLDAETKTCIRGVTILTWGERRFWEKLRFAMPASSTIGGGNGSSSGVIGSGSGVIGFSGTGHRSQHSAGNPVVCDNNLKGRTSTVVVTNCGYPTLAPSSLSSSSSLARSSVLYDCTTTQPIYYQQPQGQQSQHHYHYAQLPSTNNQSTMSLHKLAKHQQQQQSPGIRNPFSTKPLPPPPNQPLPPLPLVSSSGTGSPFIHGTHMVYNASLQSQPVAQEQVSAPPPYVEYTNHHQHHPQQQQQPQPQQQDSSNVIIMSEQQHHQTIESDQAESCMTVAPGQQHQTILSVNQRNHQQLAAAAAAVAGGVVSHHRSPQQQSYYPTHRSQRPPL